MLEADHAGGQMNLSQPPITDLDGGADVHVRLGDRLLPPDAKRKETSRGLRCMA